MIKQAEYIGSYPSESKCLVDYKPEYAFIGRSNVGKSSLINMLTSRKDLARVSNTPGKTQNLNFYLIDKSWYLVDLPGYGYARLSKKQRAGLEKMIEGYLLKRNNLGCAFVLIDGTIPPQGIDIEFVNWMGQMQIPFVLVFTKTDKLRNSEKDKYVDLFQAEMHKYWNELPEHFVTSSAKKLGREELLEFIDSINAKYQKK